MLTFAFIAGMIFRAKIKTRKKQDSGHYMKTTNFNKDAPRNSVFILFLTDKLLSLTIFL